MEPVDRDRLVVELRRQVRDAVPADDNRPWRQAFLDLADSLDGTEWLRDEEIRSELQGAWNDLRGD